MAEVIAWNTKWEFAKNSKIHTDSPTLYFSNVAKKKTKQYVLMQDTEQEAEKVLKLYAILMEAARLQEEVQVREP